ncbi:MAG: hypothetical protein HC802_14345 [Caldilineaceae bacterium]|nr:hypothetical protein [Caldilineaceae bacterium]
MAALDSLASQVQGQVQLYVVNGRFDQAVLFFHDGSFLQFEHTSVDNRWAKTSAVDSMAGNCFASMRLFRLNAKHLQLYMKDGSDAEFFTREAPLSDMAID